MREKYQQMWKMVFTCATMSTHPKAQNKGGTIKTATEASATLAAESKTEAAAAAAANEATRAKTEAMSSAVR